MQCRQIEFGSAEYELSLALRQKVLREPLGLVLSNHDLNGEDQQLHFALFAEDQHRLLACLVINPLTPSTAKLRQMAVTPDSHGQGLGMMLVKDTENLLRKRGVQTVEMHARTSATGFYQKLGYEPSGPVFTEVGIEHQKMWRRL
jgi:predicted GNAT family N-acyltransferase